jgi:hypothetical protein
MKKAMYTILIAIVVFVGIGYYVFQNAMILATYTSPNGNYKAIIKRDTGFFSSTMPGDGGSDSLPVIVILKDKSGKTIGSSNDNPRCSIFYGSIEIKWDLENGWLWYGKARTIDINTGKVEC